jgi:hypothetical protein
MTKNLGSVDRGIRAVLGVVIIAAGFIFNTWWGAVGIVPLFTALVGWCPAYVPFGISTCAVKRAA